MQRKLTLAKNSYLWEEGDQARNIAIVEKGKLAVRTADGIVGVVLPKMVVGEGAINAGWATDDEGNGNGNGNGHRRAASAVALEDDTVVVEYAPSRIKEAFDNGEPAIGQQILITLMGQASRNLLIVISSEDVHPLTVTPVKGLLNGMVKTLPELKLVEDWKSFLTAFQCSHELPRRVGASPANSHLQDHGRGTQPGHRDDERAFLWTRHSADARRVLQSRAGARRVARALTE